MKEAGFPSAASQTKARGAQYALVPACFNKRNTAVSIENTADTNAGASIRTNVTQLLRLLRSISVLVSALVSY